MKIAQTPPPPYYAVVFCSTLRDETSGYHEMSELILELANQQKGFLGFESAREEIGISISYWKDIESIRDWKNQSDHLIAQQLGKDIWYKTYRIRICRVDREYGFGLDSSLE